jgi:Domain of unknown function (DUF4105)
MGDMKVRRLASALMWALVALLVIAPVGAWGTLALWYRLPVAEAARAAVAGLFTIISVVTFVALFTPRRWSALLVFALAFGATVLWWGTIAPPLDGDWAPDVARQTTGRLDGNILTLSDVRDFDWRSGSDFTPRWSERSYDLTKLRDLDLYLDYWAGPEMAHLMMSFGFEDGQELTWSLEVRRKGGGEFSPVADTFKTDTLISLATTERDSIRLRSNVRHEDLRLYRLNTSPESARILLLGYVDEANALKQAPQFYNSITTNCTTAVAKTIRKVGGDLPFDWRLIVNGYLPSLLYEKRVVANSIPLDELIALASIRTRALEADQSPNFSQIIRKGVPSPLDGGAPYANTR